VPENNKIMQMQFTPDTVMRGIELVVMLGGGWLGLRIQTAVAEVRTEIAEVRTEQAQVKADLIERQTQMRLDLDEKHAENKDVIARNEKTVAVHIAADEQQFKTIASSLERIERKIDSGNGVK
jgi:hypothetical protein